MGRKGGETTQNWVERYLTDPIVCGVRDPARSPDSVTNDRHSPGEEELRKAVEAIVTNATGIHERMQQLKHMLWGDAVPEGELARPFTKIDGYLMLVMSQDTNVSHHGLAQRAADMIEALTHLEELPQFEGARALMEGIRDDMKSAGMFEKNKMLLRDAPRHVHYCR